MRKTEYRVKPEEIKASGVWPKVLACQDNAGGTPQ